MASPRKIRANRANARASTGPKTAQGRARTARNALRHGLSVPVFSGSVFSEEVDALGPVDSKDSLLSANQIQGFFWGGGLGCDGSFGF